MKNFRRISRVLKIELVVWVVILIVYFWMGSQVSALDNATRILGDPSEPGFKLTLVYLLIHFSLIALLPVYIAIRLTGICWDWKLRTLEKQ